MRKEELCVTNLQKIYDSNLYNKLLAVYLLTLSLALFML